MTAWPALLRRHPFESLVVTAWAAANVALLLQDLRTNPQVDLQLYTNMFALGQAVTDGSLGEFLLTVRKYPLLPSIVMAIPSAVTFLLLRLAGVITDFGEGLRAYVLQEPWQLILVLRAMFLALAALTMRWTWQLSKAIWHDTTAALTAVTVLGGSLLWTLYGTALRPHVAVAAMTTVAGLLAVRHLQSPSRSAIVGSFAAATIAFCSLQNGALAFIFPVWASLRTAGWKRGTLHGAWGLTAAAAFSTAFGYPFFLRAAFGLQEGFDLELGHNHTAEAERWSLHGLTVIRDMLLYSEWLLGIAVCTTVVMLIFRVVRLREEHMMLWTFVVLYFGVFGIYSSPHPRYFLATFPILCALTAGAVVRLPRNVRRGAYVVSTLFLVLLTAAALRPNTYRLAEDFLLQHPGTVGTNLPPYLLGIEPTRASIGEPTSERDRWIKTLPADLPGARRVTTLDDPRADVRVALWNVTDDARWYVCKTFGTPSGGPGMLWGEIDRPLLWLFQTTYLGPVISAQCRVK